MKKSKMNEQQKQVLATLTCGILDRYQYIEEDLKSHGIPKVLVKKMSKAMDLIFEVNQSCFAKNNEALSKQPVVGFTITTSQDVAEKIKKQCEWDERMNANRSFILGKITHEKGLTSNYSVVKIKARDGVKIEPSDIFFLGLFAAGQ